MPERIRREHHILLVEDNPGDARLITEMLKDQQGYRLTTADSLTSAFEYLGRNQVDIVLLDLGLSESKGLNTLMNFRDRYPELPTIVLTGLDDEEAALGSLRMGAQDFLQKGRTDGDIISRSVRYSLERSESLKALQESEDRYRGVVEDTPVLICSFLPGGEITFVNKIYSRYFDTTQEELIGLNFLSLIPEPDRDRVISNISALSQDSPSQSHEHRVMLNSGEIRWQRWTNRALFNTRGEVISYQAIGEDITHRKNTENALHRSEENLKEAQRIAHVGNWNLNHATGRFTWSDEVYRIFELDPGEFTPSYNAFLHKIHPDDRESVDTAFKDSFKNSAPHSITHRLLMKGDRIKFVTERCETIYSPDNEPLRSIGTVLDITESRKAVQEKQEIERQMRHAQKLESLGVLAGGIAHDFNNILMAILGNADLALMDLSTANPAYNNIKQIETAAKRAAGLAKQMLAYSGKGKFNIQMLSLNEAVDEMTHILEVSISKKAVIKYRYANNIPLIEADATQIRQIIMNLVTNASDAIERTSGVISITTGAMDCDCSYLINSYIDESQPEGQYVYVEVTDTGCGMNTETLEKLFDPFYTTKFTGRGLGLAAVLGIVRGHKGVIKVYSELGMGTSIRVLFPACSDTSKVTGTAENQTGSRRIGSGTILLVDDEETILSVGKQMLTRMGFDVLTATDGRHAVEQYREHADSIILVILDLTMPHLDGEETFRELRRIKGDVLVLMCSGYNEQEVAQRFSGKLIAGFLQKPYMFNDLKTKVREALGV